MLKSLDSIVRSNLWIYNQARRSAVFLCRYFLLEEGFSFLKHVQPRAGTTAIDIGSNDGTSIEMIQKLQPAAPIYSFDPVIPPTKYYENVFFHNIALTDKPGTIKLYIPKVRRWALTQYSSTDKEKISAQLMEDFDVLQSEIEFAEKESVSSTLDTFGLDPYFIKIDVEGQEELVVKGAISTILASKPILLIEIQSHEAYRSMQRIMDDMDYFNLRWPQSTRSMSLTSTGYYSRKKNNYLWIPKSKSDNWFTQTIR